MFINQIPKINPAMIIYRLRKLLIMLIILVPVVSYSGCKKQPKCGCSGDTITTLTGEVFDHSAIVYNSTGTSAYFYIYSGSIYYDTYYFCNPSAMYSKYEAIGSNEQLKLSGNVYWDCSYLSSTSNSSSSSVYSYYKVYDILVTDLGASLYGKK
jgi:hypothetical protein